MGTVTSYGRFIPIRMTERTFLVGVEVTLEFPGSAQKQRESAIHHELELHFT